MNVGTSENKYAIYAGGSFVETDAVLPVTNPFTGKTFAQTYLAGFEELETSIQKALTVQKELKHLPSCRKSEILKQIAAELASNKSVLAALLCRESGKPIRYAVAEVERAIFTFTTASEEARRLPKEYIDLDWVPGGINKEGIVKYFPIGPIAGITPFNFPLNLAVHKIAPAIAASCPIIIKPASATPLSCLALARIIDNTGLPKGSVSILPMTRETGNRLVTDDRFKLLSFTGSPAVGWQMKKDSGKKKVVLELGGNAGLIVTESCNLDEALAKTLTGSFSYSGQTCIHTQRIFVHKSIFDTFTQGLVKRTKKLVAGDPEDPETEVSVMIDEPNAKRVESWVQEAVNAGATILCGGKREGTFYAPTILTGTNNYMRVCSEEIFGPVVTIEPYTAFEEAVAFVNDTQFGLQAGVFTANLQEVNYAFNHLEVGGVIINDVPNLRIDHMPYGGIKDSGLGREGVKYALHDMLEPKIMVKDML